MIAAKCQWVFSAPCLNARGTAGQCCRRQRGRTPCRLGLALPAPWAGPRGETLAACPCGGPALFGPTGTDKALYPPVAKPSWANVARPRTARLGRDLPRPGLWGRWTWAAGRHLVRQDGRALALHDSFREGWPGCCTGRKPAAVALHLTLALRGEAPTTVGWRPATSRASSAVCSLRLIASSRLSWAETK